MGPYDDKTLRQNPHHARSRCLPGQRTLYDSLTRQTLTITNQRDTLIEALAPFADRDLALCEATGGHEDGLLAILHALAIPAHRADAAMVKAYIRSCGKRAKTDPIDARWLAQYGLDRAASLTRWQPPEACQARIAALIARRDNPSDASTKTSSTPENPSASPSPPSCAKSSLSLTPEPETLSIPPDKLN